MNTFKKALSLLTGTDKPATLLTIAKAKSSSDQITQRELIQMESQIGSRLFGEIPKGHRREFFNLDPTTWIWYEEWVDSKGKKCEMTTRYELQGERILKVQEGARYSYIEGEERTNLISAIKQYYDQVMRRIYHMDPQTGKALF